MGRLGVPNPDSARFIGNPFTSLYPGMISTLEACTLLNCEDAKLYLPDLILL